jgi:hypothetical protein
MGVKSSSVEAAIFVQIRATVIRLNPLALAMERTREPVAPRGMLSNVWITFCGGHVARKSQPDKLPGRRSAWSS